MNKKPDVITTPRLRLGPVGDEQEDAVIDLLAKEEVGRTYMLPEFTCRASKIIRDFLSVSFFPKCVCKSIKKVSRSFKCVSKYISISLSPFAKSIKI